MAVVLDLCTGGCVGTSQASGFTGLFNMNFLLLCLIVDQNRTIAGLQKHGCDHAPLEHHELLVSGIYSSGFHIFYFSYCFWGGFFVFLKSQLLCSSCC